uniref:Acid phosphatase n=1 Tax=Rhabditophanes sp. KR3021 TaxID=114890 RepID=A0AC35TTB0_9BILA
MRLVVLLFNLVLAVGASDRKLLLIQSIFRHGLRTPIFPFPGDLVKGSDWPVPYGHLLQEGKFQEYNAGIRERKRYVDDLQFFESNFTISKEIYVRSTNMTRTIDSAIWRFQGFVTNETSDFKNATQIIVPIDPVTVNTDFFGTSKTWDAFSCPRINFYVEDSHINKYLDPFKSALTEIIKYGTLVSNKTLTFDDLLSIYDTVTIEKTLGYPVPEWITDVILNQCGKLNKKYWALAYGVQTLGAPINNTRITVSGGIIMKNVFDNIHRKIQNPNSQIKYYANSGHDMNIFSAFNVFGIERFIFGDDLPAFASTIMFELYQNGNDYEVCVLYAKDSDAPFEPITKYINGCNAKDYCKLEIIENVASSYIPSNITVASKYRPSDTEFIRKRRETAKKQIPSCKDLLLDCTQNVIGEISECGTWQDDVMKMERVCLSPTEFQVTLYKPLVLSQARFHDDLKALCIEREKLGLPC